MTWETALEDSTDTEVKSRIVGILTFGHIDNLSKALQTTTMSASEGQEIARKTISTLKNIRQDSNFDLFWEKLKIRRISLMYLMQFYIVRRGSQTDLKLEIGESLFHSDVKISIESFITTVLIN